MALTDTAIRNTKPADKPLKLTDERRYTLLRLRVAICCIGTWLCCGAVLKTAPDWV